MAVHVAAHVHCCYTHRNHRKYSNCEETETGKRRTKKHNIQFSFITCAYNTPKENSPTTSLKDTHMCTAEID